MHCRVWCSALVVMAVVVWSWDASCVHCEGHCSTESNSSQNSYPRNNDSELQLQSFYSQNSVVTNTQYTPVAFLYNKVPLI